MAESGEGSHFLFCLGVFQSLFGSISSQSHRSLPLSRSPEPIVLSPFRKPLIIIVACTGSRPNERPLREDLDLARGRAYSHAAGRVRVGDGARRVAP